MKKNLGPEFGFFNPRIFVAFVLCLVGVSLAVFSFAVPTLAQDRSRFVASPTSANWRDKVEPGVLASAALGQA